MVSNLSNLWNIDEEEEEEEGWRPLETRTFIYLPQTIYGSKMFPVKHVAGGSFSGEIYFLGLGINHLMKHLQTDGNFKQL